MDTSSGNKGYSSSIAAFSIGIIAVIAAVIYSLVTKGSILVIICEAIVLISLIVLLIISLKSKAKISEQMLKEELSPYASVNKNEIYQLFDMIEDAKSRRDISDAFAAGGNQKAEPEKQEEEASDDSMLIIFPDAEDEDASANSEKADEKSSADSENKIEKIEKTEKAEKTEKTDTVETKNGKPFGRRASDKLTDPNDKTSNTGKDGNTMGEYDYDGRAGGRRRTDVDPNARSRDPYARRRQGYDPYYDDVYYNEYGEPVRRRRPPAYDPYYSDVYYNEYGEPVRRRPAQSDPYARGGDVYYNEYGEPVRRRRPPVDAYGRPVQQQRRRPAEDPRRRYDAAEGAEPRRRRPADAAPAPADDVQSKAAEGAAPVPAPAETTAPAPQAEAPAQPARPDNYYDDDYVPIVLPSDDPMEDDYYDQAPARRSAAGVRRYDDEVRTPPTRSRDRNRYQDDDDVDYDPVPVVVPVFDDEDDYAPPARDRGYDDPQGDSAPRSSSRAVEEDDDGYIPVSIPVDENDDPLPTDADIPRMPVPKKNISKVKIGKIRRKKIVRNSRKYKKFRASVHSLDNYLHNFSNKSKGL